MPCSRCKVRPRVEGRRYCAACHAAYQQRYRKAIRSRTIAQVNLLLADAGSPHRVTAITYAGRVVTSPIS
jgi:hypothetical protein